jgi:SSS family solute:Na+ symporter
MFDNGSARTPRSALAFPTLAPPFPAASMHVLDWIVVGLYVATVVGLGWWANRLQTDTEAYFVGNRGVRWWAAGLSIIATSFSAASVLGMPGYAYADDMWYLQFQIGDILAAGIVAALFIPFFHKIKELTTAYEYLEVRFDTKTRQLGSALFIFATLLRGGALLYGASLLFSEIVPTNVFPGLPGVEEAVIIFGVIAITYTVVGGISAVIWTDVIQFGLIVLGVIASIIVVITSTPGGTSATFETAASLDKLQVLHADEPFAFKGIVTAIFGYGLLALSLYGTNQQPVQRYMTVENPREAQKALLLGVGTGAISVALSLLMGVFLFVFYDFNPGLLAEGIGSDQVMPQFIENRLPPVITGGLVAAVFAAAMSSLDSALNSTAAAITVDFYTQFKEDVAEQQRLFFAKIVVITAGALGIGVGIYASRTGELLIDIILDFLGWVGGGMLGLFVLGMLTRRANGFGAFIGAIVGVAAALILTDNLTGLSFIAEAVGIVPFPSIWATAVGLVVTLAVGYALSLVVGRHPPPGQLENTTVQWIDVDGRGPQRASSGGVDDDRERT